MVAARSVYSQKNKEQEGETPQRRTAITEKRKRYAYHGTQAYDHSYIDGKMENEIGCNAISIDTAEYRRLPFGDMNHPEDKGKEQQQYKRRADESLLLSYGAVYEVGVLLGDIFKFGLRAV